MAALERLRASLPALMERYYELQRDAEAHRGEERAAALALQAAWRGHAARAQVQRLDAAALRIQSCWRGHVGRRRARAARLELERRRRQARFALAATEIQRRWRGHRSRAHVHDFYARRRYLAAVAERSRAVRLEAAREAEEALRAQRESAAEAAQARLSQRAACMSHLLSTAARAGVLRPPRAPAAPPAAGDGPELERLVRDVSRRQAAAAVAVAAAAVRVSSEPAASAAAGTSGGGGGGGTSGGPARETLRQSAPYNAARDEASLEAAVSKRVMLAGHAGSRFESALAPRRWPFGPDPLSLAGGDAPAREAARAAAKRAPCAARAPARGRGAAKPGAPRRRRDFARFVAERPFFDAALQTERA